MDFDQYQREAASTDKTLLNFGGEVKKDIVVGLLGIAGELGTLAATYKKYLRDGTSYELHSEHVCEELGDLLWYCSILADKFGLSLQEVAEKNLIKTKDRWGGPQEEFGFIYDAGFEISQRFPRQLKVDFAKKEIKGRVRTVMFADGQPLGDPLTDNSEMEDGYSFHDAFHLSFMANFGWSPVIRALMGRKRKGDPEVDENEDGGRAKAIEEGIVAMIFEYGVDHGGLAGVPAIDHELIKTVKTMTRNLEVKQETGAAWQKAIQDGWRVFNALKTMQKGTVECDLDQRKIVVV